DDQKRACTAMTRVFSQPGREQWEAEELAKSLEKVLRKGRNTFLKEGVGDYSSDHLRGKKSIMWNFYDYTSSWDKFDKVTKIRLIEIKVREIIKSAADAYYKQEDMADAIYQHVPNSNIAADISRSLNAAEHAALPDKFSRAKITSDDDHSELHIKEYLRNIF